MFGLPQTIIIAILAVVLIGGGVYVVKHKSTPTEQVNTDTDASDTDPETPFSGSGSFRDLLNLGHTAVCDVTYSDENSVVTGTSYIAQNRVRGDFTIETKDNTFESHFIHQDEMLYSWTLTPGGITALKMSTATEGETGDTNASQGVDLNQHIEYDCRPWTVDESEFTPPAAIEFKTQAELMQGMMMGTNGNTENQCGACAQISDTGARTQCLTALRCN
ncbi:hypothetical protein GW943_01930 [Candidatus Parcubacteria bacterium]|uniref:Uncharacterized protein n=1 Tax=Candidatus Kaiserbacteria bacterium CG10_big_fil_rev_8_21_14_0_10_47_16 TaxID=1974608 RepID=A0A2H0UEK8_9BACT|nr:hypothetical protein [Candidatus Parcubacteria bacterium]PIR84790.1 MAG: hypothetical protein COU16_01225 [Candidatus Kaiserbacteria bacterium CG10_big_fil_rev_8_21_14_0_10_47_16]